MKNKINKSQLEEIVSKDTKISRKVVNLVINSFIENLGLALKSSNVVNVTNLGKFSLERETPSKYSRHDRKYSSYSVLYTPSITLTQTLNNTPNDTISL